jgi:hypothetical protein
MELDERPITDELHEETQAPSSLLDTLRAKREERAAERHFDIELPGYDGLLVLRCGPIPGRTLTLLRERSERSKSPERDFNLNADTLIAACREVLGREQRSHPLRVLPDADGEPVRIDERLADLLQLPATSARDVLRCLFENANSPEVAVAYQAGLYMEWAASSLDELDEELLGES